MIMVCGMFVWCSLDVCVFCVVVSVMLVVCSLSVFLSMCLFVLYILCLTVLVNCLLNAFAICAGECFLLESYGVVFVLMALDMFMFVKVLSSLISVMSPPPCLCSLSVRMVV